MLKRFSALVIAGAALAACSESSQPTGPVPTPGGANQSVLAELTCRVDVASSSMSCASPSPASVAGRSSDLILGGQNVYVKLTSTITGSTPTVSINADVTVKNLTGQPWGVDSLGALDTAAVKVFVVQPPTSPVVIANPTGTAFFTASNQQYFKYTSALIGGDGILSPGETSSPINWQFTLNGATNFTFGVLIVADMPDEQGTLRWVRDTLPITGPPEALFGVWGASSTDVWVGSPYGGPTGLMHWNGSSWTGAGGYCTASPLTCVTTALWGAGSTDVWAVGGEILHYTGGTWVSAVDPASTMRSIWGSASSNVYAGGDNGTMYQYNGTTWSVVSQATTGLGPQSVTSIWGTAANNVYVGTAGGGIRRFNGTSWAAVSSGIGTVRAIWGSGASDIYAGGDTGLLRHWNGSTWSTVSAGFGADPFSDSILGIWGSAANNVFVAERNGTLWHYNGYTWVSLSNAGVSLAGIWGSGRDVFAVGYGTGGVTNSIAIRGMR